MSFQHHVPTTSAPMWQQLAVQRNIRARVLACIDAGNMEVDEIIAVAGRGGFRLQARVILDGLVASGEAMIIPVPEGLLATHAPA